MPRLSLPLFATLLLSLSNWSSVQAGALPTCTNTFGAPGTVTCVDILVEGLSVQGSGLLPLGVGGGANSNGTDATYGDVQTRVTLSEIGTGGGHIKYDGIVDTTVSMSGALTFSLNLLLEDVDPLYNFANGETAISTDFNLSLQFTASADIASTDLLNSVTLTLLSPTTIKIPLFDVNGNNQLDALFIDNIDLTSLDGLLVDFTLPATGYPSANLTLGSASGTFDGRVEDVLTDPPFTLAVVGGTPTSQVPAPASLWLLAMGGLLVSLGARRLG